MQRRSKVIAFHCSGANAAQWRPLTEALTGEHEVLAPEHIGCKSRGSWHGQAEFSLAHEAEPTIALLDELEAPVHLVGHSYGGAVALNIALQRPNKIASLTLYEPSAFYLLPQLGPTGTIALTEILKIANQVRNFVSAGNCRAAAEAFVEYWNGAGSWEAMHPKIQNALISWTPKAPLDFHALLNDTAQIHDLQRLEIPTVLVRGEHAPKSTETVSDVLQAALPFSSLVEMPGAGHMGPITHAASVAAVIAGHVQSIETKAANSIEFSSGLRQLLHSPAQTWRLAS